MNLRDIMRHDAECILRNPNDFGETCRIAPHGGAAGIVVSVLMQPSPAQQAQQDEGMVVDRQSTALIDGQAYRAAMWELTGTDRGPIEGDELTFESGENLGRWVALPAQPMPGDQYRIPCVWQAAVAQGQQRSAQ